MPAAPRRQRRQQCTAPTQSAILRLVVGAARADAEECQSAGRCRAGDAGRRLYRADAHAGRRLPTSRRCPRPPIPAKKKSKAQAGSRESRERSGKSRRMRNPRTATPPAAKPADGKAAASRNRQGHGSAVHWTPMSSSALAASPPPDLKADAPRRRAGEKADKGQSSGCSEIGAGALSSFPVRSNAVPNRRSAAFPYSFRDPPSQPPRRRRQYGAWLEPRRHAKTAMTIRAFEGAWTPR